MANNSITTTIGNVIDNLLGVVQTTDTGSFKFPSNLSANNYMLVNFYQYQRQSPLAVGSAAQRGSLKLPIPANIVDAQSVNYVEEEIGTALGGLSQGAMGGTDLGGFGAVPAGGGAAALNKAFPGLATLGGVKFGVSANPFLTVLFKTPNYREYDFSWRFFPRNQAESRTLEAIYKSVKYHMVPAANKGFGGALLTYPSLVKVVIVAGNRPLIPFKYGVVKSAAFNFAPDGVPSFHKAGQPTAVDFRMQIQEVEYFLKGDNQAMFAG